MLSLYIRKRIIIGSPQRFGRHGIESKRGNSLVKSYCMHVEFESFRYPHVFLLLLCGSASIVLVK